MHLTAGAGSFELFYRKYYVYMFLLQIQNGFHTQECIMITLNHCVQNI